MGMSIIPTSAIQHDTKSDTKKDLTTTTLSNGISIPLIGFGVGNLQHELIHDALRSVFSDEKKVRLIDTARASHNEHIIADAISKSDDIITKSNNEDEVGGIHVMTKIWYTHLGYERTKLSVEESLLDLASAASSTTTIGNVPIYVHMLLHWPRCDDNISWMRCEEEENNLPQYVKDVGPAPHLDKANAWKESWRALEEIYTDHQQHNNGGRNNVKIVSIGVSNFDFNDMNALVQSCQIKPHILQGNVWSLMFDPYLMNLLQEQHIVFQAYNIMNGIWQQRSKAPIAFRLLTEVGTSLTSKIQQEQKQKRLGRIGGEHNKKASMDVTESMVIMSWLVQEGIIIIPRASSTIHQQTNSPETIKLIPLLSIEEREQVKKATMALLRGEDVKIEATFHNLLSSDQPVEIHWINIHTKEEVQVIEEIHPGSSHTIETHPGHAFAVYNEGKSKRREFLVDASYGEKVDFAVDEL